MKTATSSVATFLGRWRKEHPISIEYRHFGRHWTPDRVLREEKREATYFDDKFCVLFVRNPYERTVSFYHFMRQTGGHAQKICRSKSFPEFILEEDIATIMVLQSDYMYCQGKKIIDFIGKYENLDEDVYRLIEATEFNKYPELKERWGDFPHLQSSKHADYHTYYTPQTKEAVYEKLKADFEAFGYER